MHEGPSPAKLRAIRAQEDMESSRAAAYFVGVAGLHYLSIALMAIAWAAVVLVAGAFALRAVWWILG